MSESANSSPQPLDQAPEAAGKSSFNFAKFWDDFGMTLLFVVLFAACALSINNFLSWANMKGLGQAVFVTGMVSCGMVFCLACGDLDLSVGAVVACAGVITAWLMREAATSWGMDQTSSMIVGMLGGVLTGVFFGTINGLCIAVLKNNALIVTLAVMWMARGTGYIMCDNGKPIGIANDLFLDFGYSSIGPIPTPIVLTAICFVVFGIILHQTSFGRNTLAMGGNEEAARLAGVNVTRTKILIFTMTGAIAAFAGVVLTAKLTSGQPMNGMGLELNAISACVLGGVSLKGGIGRMPTVLAGVLILGTVDNAMNLMNIDSFHQHVVRGAILLLAINLDQYKQKLRFSST
ncbi:MAG: L-arabinose ABC transporter permease AraH [Methylobacteriaceae bacterium]|jgi:L-arabinose transport system permease protein|nr:L-arabinose ABC transporter permease AraH [Methylobacteriaceae bacterium]